MALPTVDFGPLLAELEADRALMESIRDESKLLETSHRSLSSILNRAHSIPLAQARETLLLQSAFLSHLSSARDNLERIRALVPPHEFWKRNDAFSQSLQRLTFDVLLAWFLGTGELLSKEDVCQVLNIRPEHAPSLLLPTEDYLHALISLLNELSRLAVNSVTLGDFATPLRLSTFVKELHAGFQLLNLKNDSLRKRFDGIKYDIKKIEEVVYDVSLRGLLKGDQAASGRTTVLGSDEEQAKIIREELLRAFMGQAGVTEMGTSDDMS